MSKHLNIEEINKYRQSILEPVDLLTVDLHLADCKTCRQKIRRRWDLEMLYESFFSPTNELGDRRSYGKWRILKKLRFFTDGILFSSRQPQIAVILIGMLFIGGLLAVWQGIEQPTTELVFQNINEQKTLAIGAPDFPDVREEAKADVKEGSEIAQTPEPIPMRPAATSRASQKSGSERTTIEISELENDGSATLGSANSSNDSVAPHLKVEGTNLRNDIAITLPSIDHATEYEAYLVEVPSFVTVGRKRLKGNRWLIPGDKLKTGRNYVLQVTALNDGHPIQIIKRAISVKRIK